MTLYQKETVQFQNLSAIDFGAKSCLGEAGFRWNGISIAGTQGTTAGLLLNVTSASADNCAQVLQRLITILFEKKSVS